MYGRIDSMRIPASKLRKNIYQILDEVIATGTPVEIVRKGTVLRIVLERPSKLARLKKRTGFEGDPDEIIGMDWMREWTSNARLVS
jgi:prevent-host-death family protein